VRALFLGDLLGRTGRKAAIDALPALREELDLDFVVVNAENAASGYGLTASIAQELFAAGADVVTLGDHAFDQKEMLQAVERDPRILRPLNFAKTAPGRGAGIFEARGGTKVLVGVALGRVFMNRPFDDPFSAVETVLKQAPLGGAVGAAIIEIHAEATSEKMAMGHWCDGRASLVIGTHTHVPTADAMILPRGTAYQSDAGMCGDYDSVIGMERSEPLKRFVTGMGTGRFEPATGPATLAGVLVEIDPRSGRATSIVPFRRGGVLCAR